MARSGVTKAQVAAARDRLVAEGRHPSADAVRQALGDSGSKSTIHRFLKELRETGADAGGLRRETGSALQALVEQLADRVHADADARARMRAAEHARALGEKDLEIAALRRHVQALESRLCQLEVQILTVPAGNPLWTLHAHGELPAGARSNGFGAGALDSRSGRRDASPFSMTRAAAR